MTRWVERHIGFEHDGLTIEGQDIWRQKWRPLGLGEYVDLPHPAHRSQIHRYWIYEVGDTQSVRFASTELSPGVYGFYVPKG